MPFDFKHHRVLVAGGSRGIGRAIALNFAAAGADVAICARGAQALESTRADLARHGRRVHAMACDLADADAVARWVPAAAQALGGIDVLVNNASGFGRADDEDGWAASLAVDVMAMVRCSRAALPWLLQAAATAAASPAPTGSACIIHLSSISAYRPSARAAPYAAVKAAMNSYTTSQAAMWCKQGLRVNAIAPGSIEFVGGQWEQRRTTDPALYESTRLGIPAGRLGTADEVAEVALFLASHHARWINGQVLTVDGGQLLGA